MADAPAAKPFPIPLSYFGIALGTAAALLIYHGMRLISKLRGTRATTLRAFQSFNMRGHPND